MYNIGISMLNVQKRQNSTARPAGRCNDCRLQCGQGEKISKKYLKNFQCLRLKGSCFGPWKKLTIRPCLNMPVTLKWQNTLPGKPIRTRIIQKQLYSL